MAPLAKIAMSAPDSSLQRSHCGRQVALHQLGMATRPRPEFSNATFGRTFICSAESAIFFSFVRLPASSAQI
jgi:hypothetical protein